MIGKYKKQGGFTYERHKIQSRYFRNGRFDGRQPSLCGELHRPACKKLEAELASLRPGNHIRRQLAFFADQSQWPDVHLAVCACRSFAALDVREEGEDRIFHHGFYIFPV